MDAFIKVLLFLCFNVECTRSSNVISNVFARSFGVNKINSFYSGSADLLSAIQQQDVIYSRNDSKTTAPHPVFVGCAHGPYSRSRRADSAGVPPLCSARFLFASSRDRLVCYAVSCGAHGRDSCARALGLRIIGPVPTLLKIDIAVLQLLSGAAYNVDALDGHLHAIGVTISLNSNDISEDAPWISTVMHMSDKDLLDVIGAPLDLSRHAMIKSAAYAVEAADTLRLAGGVMQRRISDKGSQLWLSELRSRVSENLDQASLSASCESRLNRGLQHKRYGRHVRIKFLKSKISKTISKEDRICLFLYLSVAAADNVVTSIGLTPQFKLLNDVTRGLLQTGLPLVEVYGGLGLNGSGQVVGVADTGVDVYSCFVAEDAVNGTVPGPPLSEDILFYDSTRRKIIQYIDYVDNGDNERGHGSHVVGTIAGHCINCTGTGDYRDNSLHSFNGVAPAAKVAFFDIGGPMDALEVPPDAESLLKPSFAAGARVFSASWGGDYAYDALTVSVDEFIYSNQDMLFVVAAGNSGGIGSRTVLSPGLSKNALTVGAAVTPRSKTQSRLQVAFFSSFGPSPDGRIKPEIIAPGYSTISMCAGSEGSKIRTCEVISKAGTSMATPAVSGSAALVRQYFEDKSFWSQSCNQSYTWCRSGSFSPPGHLVKALLLHSGDGLVEAKVESGSHSAAANVGSRAYVVSSDTSYESCTVTVCRAAKEGFGLVNLANILMLPRGSHHTDVNAPDDLFVSIITLRGFEQHSYSIMCCSSSQLKITIAWYDPPNLEFAAVLLLHDVDLIVSDPSGSIFLGNHFILDPLRGGGRDNVNNNEQVIVLSPLSGIWTVNVRSNYLSAAQNVSVVVTGAHYAVEGGASSYDGDQDALLHCINPVNISYGQSESVDLVLYNYGRDKMTTDNVEDVVVIFKFSLNSSKCLDKYSMELCATSDFFASPVPVARLFLNSSYFYNVAAVCVDEGYYLLEYIRSINGNPFEKIVYNRTISTYAETETMLSLPHCSAFLSALVSQKLIKFSKSSSAGDFIEPMSCKGGNAFNDHISIPLIMMNGYWVGSHYIIVDLKTSAVLSGDMVETNFEKYSELILPASPACYEMRLLAARAFFPGPVGSNEEQFRDQPFVYFYDSHFYNATEVDPSASLNKSCPYFLFAREESAYICTDGYAKAYFMYLNESNPSASLEEFSPSRMCASSVSFISRPDGVPLRTMVDKSLELDNYLGFLVNCISAAISETAVTTSIIMSDNHHLDLLADSSDFACTVLGIAGLQHFDSEYNSTMGYYENMLLFSSESCMYSEGAATAQDICMMISYYRHVCSPSQAGLVDSPTVVVDNVHAGKLICLDIQQSFQHSSSMPSIQPTVYVAQGLISVANRLIMAIITFASVLLLIIAYACLSGCRNFKANGKKLISIRVFSPSDQFILRQSIERSTRASSISGPEEIVCKDNNRYARPEKKRRVIGQSNNESIFSARKKEYSSLINNDI